jgi:hypothetical protein
VDHHSLQLEVEEREELAVALQLQPEEPGGQVQSPQLPVHPSPMLVEEVEIFKIHIQQVVVLEEVVEEEQALEVIIIMVLMVPQIPEVEVEVLTTMPRQEKLLVEVQEVVLVSSSSAILLQATLLLVISQMLL